VSGVVRRYCLITPCRDEARYARRALDAVVRQIEAPALWVIVDDGSTDQTPEILAEYQARFPWIRVLRRADRGDRKLGGGVIDAFYTGYDAIDPAAFDYVCKFDLDLDLPPAYFQRMMDRMESEPRLATCSGKPYFFEPGAGDPPAAFPLRSTAGLVSERCGDENSVGMIKFYRTEAFRQIGGFVRELMWDGIDGHRCRQRGWIAASSDDPETRFVHLRPMGTSHRNWWTGRVRHGYGQYFMGTGPLYMLASAAYRMTRPPLVVGGVAMLWGYVRSAFRRVPRYGDAEFTAFLRSYQRACLVRGKVRATAELDARMAGRWSPGPAPPAAPGSGAQRDGNRSENPSER
jgi:glycosyltransferase involved in cell wall biosynthesis